MTAEQARANADLALKKARAALTAAQALLALSLWDDAVSRAYYAAFHAAQALLVSRGLEARSHAGLGALLWEHFVRPGVVSKSLGRDLSSLQKFREDADYDLNQRFDDESARAEVDKASRVVAEIEAHLHQPDATA